ncbi:Alpha/Beta hydrolase protein [Xylariaceae sp. FL1651]|nr:Alpha/Beta hydrolase protein [Xylariaceae sp. FL1651]
MGCSNATDQMACLRSTDINKILTFNRNAPPPAGISTPEYILWFSPLIDGVTVSGPSQAAFNEGKFVKVPMMIGDATNEGNSLIPNITSIEEVKGLVQLGAPGISDTQIDQIVAAYNNPRPLPQHTPYFSVAADIQGEAGFICPGIQTSQAAAKYLPASTIWNWRYNTTEQLEVDEGLEAWHNSDIFPIFGPKQLGPASVSDPRGYSYLPGSSNAAIVPIIRHYFISFIKHLDPNIERYAGSPIWETWGSQGGQRLRIQTNDTAMEDVTQEQLDRCQLWWDLDYLTRQ